MSDLTYDLHCRFEILGEDEVDFVTKFANIIKKKSKLSAVSKRNATTLNNSSAIGNTPLFDLGVADEAVRRPPIFGHGENRKIVSTLHLANAMAG